VQRGGCGPTCLKGGSGCNSCNLFGGNNHRQGCKCSECKSGMTDTGNETGKNMFMSGGACSTSNNGIPYPNGTAGTSWSPSSWPASKGLLPGDATHFSLNNYNNDVPLQMKAEGAAPPFSVGGGKRRKNMKKNKKTVKKRKQRGGTLTNFIGQDLINLGRQMQFGLGSAYNGLNGYKQPTNPMPWKGQLPSTANLTTLQKFM